jgi:hypothetical protein
VSCAGLGPSLAVSRLTLASRRSQVRGTTCFWPFPPGEVDISIRQTLELGATGSHQNAADGHRRDDAAKCRSNWADHTARSRRERQSVILLPAARFAAPTFVFDESR